MMCVKIIIRCTLTEVEIVFDVYPSASGLLKILNGLHESLSFLESVKLSLAVTITVTAKLSLMKILHYIHSPSISNTTV